MAINPIFAARSPYLLGQQTSPAPGILSTVAPQAQVSGMMMRGAGGAIPQAQAQPVAQQNMLQNTAGMLQLMQQAKKIGQENQTPGSEYYKDLAANTQSPAASLAAAEQGQNGSSQPGFMQSLMDWFKEGN